MNTSMMNQYKYLAKDGDGALAFNGSVPCYLPNKANGCYESENGSLVFYGKCVQNGTPSPSSPVAVEYVDGDGRIGVQNVLTQVNNFPKTICGITFSYNGNGSYSADGTISGSNSFANMNYVIGSYGGFYAGHKYAVLGNHENFYVVTCGTLDGGAEQGYLTGLSDRIITCGEFFTENARWARLQVKDGAGEIHDTIRPMIIDLTAMYGEGNEPSTVEQFKQMYPNDYYAYMYGTTLTMPDIYGIGDIRDTYEPCVWVNGALRSRLTRRIGVVDLGTMSWIISTRYNRWYSYGLSGIAKGGVYTVAANALCQNFPIQSQEASVSDLSSTGISIEGNGSQTNVRSTSTIPTTMSPAEVKTAMSGVLLYYELAAPVITLGDPQPVQSYGGATNIFHTSVVQPKIAATVVQHKATPLIYGFHVDSTISDPSNAVTYLNDAVGMTPAHMDYTNGVFNYGSWADAFFMPKPCMLRSDGTVAYYLNPNNYSKKADGTASDITNEAFDGNAMMEWGQNGKRIYYAIVPDASVDGSYSVYISDTKVNENYNCWSFYDKNNNLMPHFYTPIYSGSLDSNNKLRSLSGKAIMQSKTGTQEMAYAKANGTGWYIEVFADKTLMFLLLYLMGKSLDVQTTFGQGHTSGGSSSTPATPTGQLDDKGLFFGYSSTTNKVKVFGMEDQWGERWNRTAGLMLNNGTIYYKMTAGTADGSTATDYTDGTTTTGMLSGGASFASNGYMTKMRPHDGKMLLASAVGGGSATTYYCDYWYQSQSGVCFALLGGPSDTGSRCGFYVYLARTVSGSYWTIGAALSCKPLNQ